MLGITKNNKHSYNDFEMILLERAIEYPKKNKIKHSVPFMDGEYDFSTIYGKQSYGERTLKYRFGISSNSMGQLMSKKQKIINWLYSGNKSKLVDDSEIGYYFLAEVESEVSEKIYINYAEITVTFIAYPFKICDYEEGDIAWDDFNFELDVLQETKFDINGVKNVKIHNVGATNVVPEVICSSAMEVTKDNVTYKFNSGTSRDSVFELGIGQNDMTIKGNGTIEFKFRKEVL